MNRRSGVALALAGLMLFLVFGAFIAVRPAQAAFNPNSIISDADFTDVGTMTEAQVQSFLAAHGSYLATYVDASDAMIGPANDIPARGMTASHIIWQSANWYGLNPQVVLTTLQKEQSLVTDPAPTQGALDAAMGYACPDASACDVRYKGFAKQVDNATWQLEYNMVHANLRDTSVAPYLTGDHVTIDGSDVLLSNGATASLYRYTPHFAGNQNFYDIYQNWFPVALDSTSPAAGATGVFDTATVAATFSKQLDPATLAGGNFRLARHSDGATIATNISYDSNSRTASLTPVASLAQYTVYDATVTTAVADTSGMHLQHDHSWSFTTGQASRNYYWTWYDNVGGDNWIMLTNPSSAAQNVDYFLSIAGNAQTLANNGVVGPGESQSPRYSLANGPVKASSQTGASGLLSQRTLWPKGGNSMEEVVATPESKLSDHYYWTWYDENSPGYRDWVLIANPSASAPVYAEIRIGGNLMTDSATGNQYFDIAAGQKVTPDFPGVIDGPVEVKAWTDSGKGTTAKVMASQRVLSNYGAAFNEVAGTPATDLKSDYLWTWYDGTAPGNRDWVLVANPGVSPVYAEIRIGGNLMTDSATGNQYFDIAAGQKVTPEFPGVIDGPVEVKAWTDSGKGTTANVIASQRVTWGPSFEEVPGMSAADLKPNYHWTWYDASVAGVRNWVLIANPSATEQIDYQILIAGNPMATSSTNPGTILAGQRETPEFPGTIGGPVEVRAWVHGGTWNGNAGADNRNIMTSQRVLWKGFFNEVLGTSLSQG